METTIGADAAKLAGLQIDLLQKIRNGQITVGDLEWFNCLTAEDRSRLKSGLYLPNAYPVHANYDLSVEAMIRAGKYAYVNPNITSANFPSTHQGTADLDIILVHYGRDMQDEEIDKDLDRKGLKDAELPELLALGAKYPDLQRQFSIVARGSVWLDPADGYRGVPCLYRDGVERRLRLHWLDGRWGSNYRFAAVRK